MLRKRQGRYGYPVLSDVPSSPIDTSVVPGQLEVPVGLLRRHIVPRYVAPRVGAPLGRVCPRALRVLPGGYHSQTTTPHQGLTIALIENTSNVARKMTQKQYTSRHYTCVIGITCKRVKQSVEI